jgi:glycosyltransferase involved in cell wall biosynthesis
LKESDLFVCSSITEGYSTAVAEATIIGLPVLTTACTGMKELLEDGQYGIIVDNNDLGLENGLRDVLQHPEILQKYRERLKDRYQFFSVERRIQEIERIFDKRNI